MEENVGRQFLMHWCAVRHQNSLHLLKHQRPLPDGRWKVKHTEVTFTFFSILSAHLDHSIRLWDTKTGEKIRELTQFHGGQVTSVCLFPGVWHLLLFTLEDSRQFLTCSRDNTLKLVDMRTFSTSRTFRYFCKLSCVLPFLVLLRLFLSSRLALVNLNFHFNFLFNLIFIWFAL